MNDFHSVLYEAVLVAFGKILAKYDVFTQGVIMRDIGKEIVMYLNEHGFGFQETDSVEHEQGLSFDAALKNADKALYQAKHDGRNRIAAHKNTGHE
ncbi:histidine kinase [Candidatus Moduliflexus flocculans]|uniref:Histidine kinase n=1 Tax=Candidatus Moduliflexus flocculans TaxID=1499966 RepID=A0A0S6VVB9_9BACT|nr:histidine kinase [Candidatus Moduliflexus flocculans]